MLYKEMANSLYGKLAQGIKEKRQTNFFDLDAFWHNPPKNPLPALRRLRVPTMRPCVQALCVPRSSVIVARLDALPGWEVLSATVDGCMVKAPPRFDPDTLEAKEVGCAKTEDLQPLALYPELAAL